MDVIREDPNRERRYRRSHKKPTNYQQDEQILRVRQPSTVCAEHAGDQKINHMRISRLVTLFCEKDFGQIVDWHSIEKEVGLSDRTKIYPLLSKARAILIRNFGKFLGTQPKKGYLLLQPPDHIRSCEGEFRKGVKRVVRSADWSKSIRVNLLTDSHERGIVENKINSLCNLAGMFTNKAKIRGFSVE